MLVTALLGTAMVGTLWTDTKRTMVVPTSRLSPAAREAYRASSPQRERLLIAAVRTHPEDWSLLCVARAWRDGGAPIEAVRRVQRAQQRTSHQRTQTSSLGRRAESLEEWWEHDTNGAKRGSLVFQMSLKDMQSPEEACLILDAWYPAIGSLPEMRAWSTEAIKKFGEHPALLIWRARARHMTYINAYPDGDPRAKSPGGIPMDLPGSLADSKRALQLAPNDPGIVAAATTILMRERDPAGPLALHTYVVMNDPWAERRIKMKREFSAYFPR